MKYTKVSKSWGFEIHFFVVLDIDCCIFLLSYDKDTSSSDIINIHVIVPRINSHF